MKDEENSAGGVEKDLRKRSKIYALRVIRLFVALPKTTEAQVLGKQLLRSGTSAGSHYREAKRAKSDADFISKSKALSRSWTNRLIGSNYWSKVGFYRPPSRRLSSKRPRNSSPFSSPS
jgi:hypothetical protein